MATKTKKDGIGGSGTVGAGGDLPGDNNPDRERPDVAAERMANEDEPADLDKAPRLRLVEGGKRGAREQGDSEKRETDVDTIVDTYDDSDDALPLADATDAGKNNIS